MADGVNREVYEYTLAGALVNHFDVLQYGVEDPESVEFNPVTGTLFVMSSAIHAGDRGDHHQRDLAADHRYFRRRSACRRRVGVCAGQRRLGVQRFYIVDRGIDNNSDPNIIDGKMYEMSAPVPTTPGNLPPTVNAGTDQTITLPDTPTWMAPSRMTACLTRLARSPPGARSAGRAQSPLATHAVDTTASFTIAGSYVLRLTASDGEFTPGDEVTITVNPDPSMPILEVRVAASSDDAEEDATGQMDLESSDLELVYDRQPEGGDALQRDLHPARRNHHQGLHPVPGR